MVKSIVAERLPFCSSCPVRGNRRSTARLSKSTPTLTCAAYIDKLIRNVGVLTDPAPDLMAELFPSEPSETEAAQVATAATECARDMRSEIDVLPELELRGPTRLLELGECASMIACGQCDILQSAQQLLPPIPYGE